MPVGSGSISPRSTSSPRSFNSITLTLFGGDNQVEIQVVIGAGAGAIEGAAGSDGKIR